MSKLVRILTQRPSHNTTELLSLDNLLELAIDHSRGIPSPEKVILGIPVVLATELIIGLSVFLGATPGLGNGDSLAGAVVGETACLAEVVAGATMVC